MLEYPNIDPVIFHIYGVFALRWYSLAYIIGFLSSFLFLRSQNRKLKIMPEKYCEQLLTWIMLGILIGARLFDCLFYNFDYTIMHPLSIFRIFDGGMSFHGGMIGVSILLYVYSKIYKINMFKIIDLCVVVVPIALFFGRIANFINGELYGTITYTSPFRMIFPLDNTGQPRHPSQLYEAFSEGICLFVIMFCLYEKTNIIKHTGALTGQFVIFYSIARFICEYFRKPEISNIFGLTVGQMLSIPMFIIGIYLSIRAFKCVKQ